MKYLLIIVFLTSGQYTEKFSTLENCHDAMVEAQLVKGNDVWSALCAGPDDEVYAELGEMAP